ncbi:phosphonate C-P lyase system protein PhnH [Blastochloris sulfoviridis]|uniref:Phosphonate C-P lyase system protein PhnH n=1 Tax=Blastochloris sulfoviridis TaxID=50712 RepID=A0A5M6I5S9_9HYPH|nr:phosphonate C-P lyase system protein PhnH [Blastochloris sulfoviridis]KAA5603590.1 phosphonate C-P lyase system protein PhnH [Blastochloris sulfoviridis]
MTGGTVSLATVALAPGFADPVFDAQRAFRSVMAAMARPGRIEPLASELAPPAPMTPALAALALTLADQDTPLWLDAALMASPEVAEFLRFHAGAPIIADPAAAAFALVSDPRAMPLLDAFAQGSDAYPDRSATLLVQVERFSGASLMLAGPGIAGTATFAASPLPDDFVERLKANRAAFPRGVDLVLCTANEIAALPRSVRLVEAA